MSTTNHHHQHNHVPHHHHQGEQAGVTQERVQEEFLRARRLLGLIELDEDQLAAYIRAHKTGACVL